MKHAGLLDLNEAVQHPGKKLTFDVTTELAEEEDLDLIEPVVGRIEAVSTGNLLLVKGHFTTRCVLECARCGHPLRVKLDFRMDDQFPVEGVPSFYSHEGYAHVEADEPSPMFQQNALIRDNYVRQGLLVNIPVQPLCSYGWDGPCPYAAEREVSHAPSGHPAFRSLGQLKQEDDGEA